MVLNADLGPLNFAWFIAMTHRESPEYCTLRPISPPYSKRTDGLAERLDISTAILHSQID